MSTERAQDIEDQAIAWCLRLHEGDPTPAEQQALDAWLAQNPAHRECFVRMRLLWGGIVLDAHAHVRQHLAQRAHVGEVGGTAQAACAGGQEACRHNRQTCVFGARHLHVAAQGLAADDAKCVHDVSFG